MKSIEHYPRLIAEEAEPIWDFLPRAITFANQCPENACAAEFDGVLFKVFAKSYELDLYDKYHAQMYIERILNNKEK